jgi:hypothetical protein
VASDGDNQYPAVDTVRLADVLSRNDFDPYQHCVSAETIDLMNRIRWLGNCEMTFALNNSLGSHRGIPNR